MKHPRLRLSIEVTWNEYLGLLWSLESLDSGGWQNGPWLPDRQTVRKIKSFERKFRKIDRAWREKNLKFLRDSK